MLMLMQKETVAQIAAVRKGDQAALESLYDATRAKLYGVLLRLLGTPETAAEVLQEIYLKVWRTADQFDPAVESPNTWMVAMARSRAIDTVSKQHIISSDDNAECLSETADKVEATAVPTDTPTPLTLREKSDEPRRLLSCIGKLDPERQRLVLLAYYSGWNREQLARNLDVPVNTIKAWLRRSLLEIRDCLGTFT